MNLSRIKFPVSENGIELTLEIKDPTARQLISEISTHVSGTMSYVGDTPTPISSGSSINPIEINGQDYTATSGTCVSSRGGIFLYTGTNWREFGSVAALRALAYKDSVSAEYKPEGTITRAEFTGKQAVITANTVPRGNVKITNEEVDEEEANFVAKGTVTAPTVKITPQTKTIVAVSTAGRKPSCVFPQLEMSLVGEGLSLTWKDGSFDPGTGGSGSEEIDVVTGFSEIKVTEPQFIGTPMKIEGKFQGEGSLVELDYKPEGEISVQRFEGEPATITSQ